jgi:alkanesulfonate monooxygenase SsuD/methylene tetrahydromethanopterin reductase-like flavin-dependent oxidoreductase (luciferase family)
MKVGIGYYSLQSPPHNQIPHQKLYAEMLEEISFAEGLGFESAWITEHHFVDDGYCPSLMVTAAAIAARTKKVRIGTSVFLLPLHNPIRVAEDAAVVDIISGGRLVLGFGLGYRREEYDDGFGIPLKERKGRMEESIEILYKSWENEAFSFNGRYYRYNNVNVTPKPVQRPIPIMIGAYTEPAIRRAARLGVPLFIPATFGVPFAKKLIEVHHGVLVDLGKNPEDLEHPVVRDTYVSNEKKEKAWDRIKEHLTYPYKKYASWGSMVDREGNVMSDPNDPILYDVVRGNSILGTPEECIEEIIKLKSDLPMDNLICRFNFPGLSHEEAMQSIKLFAEKVMPAVT